MGSEPEILVGLLPLQTDAGNRLGTAQSLFRDDEFTVDLAKDQSGGSKAGTA